jgi:polyketide biosynthesis enoyl-CoA hydratase PksH
MDNVSSLRHETVRVRQDGEICTLQIYRPEANNTINARLVAECAAVVRDCESWAKVVVLEGLPEVFCFGADLASVRDARLSGESPEHSAEALYALWLQLKRGPFVSVAHVQGRANAGGVGFAAACDLVLCDENATFSLSELLFGLMPACVMPFLVERIGSTRAQAMTLLTQPVPARQAVTWGLADACAEDSANLLRLHLLRLRMLPKAAIARQKRYLAALDGQLEAARPTAIACNVEVFSDETNLARITDYLATGVLPWQTERAHNLPATRSPLVRPLDTDWEKR